MRRLQLPVIACLALSGISGCITNHRPSMRASGDALTLVTETNPLLKNPTLSNVTASFWVRRGGDDVVLQSAEGLEMDPSEVKSDATPQFHTREVSSEVPFGCLDKVEITSTVNADYGRRRGSWNGSDTDTYVIAEISHLPRIDVTEVGEVGDDGSRVIPPSSRGQTYHMFVGLACVLNEPVTVVLNLADELDGGRADLGTTEVTIPAGSLGNVPVQIGPFYGSFIYIGNIPSFRVRGAVRIEGESYISFSPTILIPLR